METNNFFLTQTPSDPFLSTIVDQYFYVDAPVSALTLHQEYIIPFPRITFGYFFNHPFLVTNHSLNKSAVMNLGISRVSTDNIWVHPQSDRIRIIGAHLQPYALAYFCSMPVNKMPWLINIEELHSQKAAAFQMNMATCQHPVEMFSQVENFFLNSLLQRDISLIKEAVHLINSLAGNIHMKTLASQLGVSDRTVRTQFETCIGCSPKVYARLVKLKQVAFQLQNSPDSLTHIALDNHYFDQAHFIRDVKNITGNSPNALKKEMVHFRFLQF